MTTAIVIGGNYPQHYGRVVELDNQYPHEFMGGVVEMLYTVVPKLRDQAGVEIWWQEKHLSILPSVVPEEIEREEPIRE